MPHAWVGMSASYSHSQRASLLRSMEDRKKEAVPLLTLKFYTYLGVLNNNIIEQVTDFKYLAYCISEFKSDVEDKLQTYNKINGAIRRYF